MGNKISTLSKMDPKTFPDGNDSQNPVRIYMDGVFDGFHYGHARLLKQGKDKFPHVHLIVGVCLQDDVEKYKGKTLSTRYERIEAIKNCKWADEVVDAPWITSVEFLDSIKAHYCARDALPYPCGDIEDCYGPLKVHGRFLATERTEGISTTDLIMRVIKDYSFYVKRNIKKGSTAEEMNLTKEKYDEFKKEMEAEKVDFQISK